jgi:allantoin racemase
VALPVKERCPLRMLLINPNTSAAVTALLAARVGEVLGSGVTVVPVTGRFGARYIASRAAVAVAGHAALEALAEHVAGCDAVYLACFGDPSISALREISPVPVVGMAEASCRLACTCGDRFAIITGGMAWQPMLQELVAELGLTDRLAAIRTIAPTGHEIARQPAAQLAQLAKACISCATEDGADAVVLGGAAFAGLAAQLQAEVPAPVICSVEAGARAFLEACTRVPLVKSPTPTESIGLAPALAKLLGA